MTRTGGSNGPRIVALLTSKPFPFSVVVKAELVLWDGQLSFWHRIIYEEPSPFRDGTLSIMFTSP